jgi:hypothetical protein
MAGSIESLIAALEVATDFSIENLERIMAENLPSENEICSISSATLPYGRTPIKATDKYELIIGCWPRNGWCDAHDHGTAIGVVHSYSGEIEHFRYELHDNSLDLVEQCTISKGETARLDHSMIHALQNVSSDDPYVGLHLYAPPTSHVRVFDLRNGDIYHVTDESAALIPNDDRFIVRKEQGVFSYRNLVKTKEVAA